MKVIVVNEQDEIIGVKDRNDRGDADIIRVSAAWLINSHGEVLIAQRALDKVRDPGKWGPSVAGTVEEGETYESNILKEIHEELGVHVDGAQLQKALHRFVHTSHKYFSQTFLVHCDALLTDIVIQKEEVNAVQWIATDTLKEWFERSPEDFIPSFGTSILNLERL